MNAFHFGQRLRIKLAAGPGLPASTASLTGKSTLPTQAPQSSTSGTMSLARPNQAPSFNTMTTNSGASPPPPPLPPQPASKNGPPRQGDVSTWAGYLTNTNNGLMKDIADYPKHFLPQTWNPWSEAYQSADARYKNLPTDRNLLTGSRAAAATAVGTGVTAAALPVVAPGLASMPLFGTGGAAAGSAAGTAAAGSQTPAGQQMIGRVGQVANQAQQTLGNLSTMYTSRVEPLLNRIGYKPEDVLHDAAAAATGNFNSLKGPSWTGRFAPLNARPMFPALPAGSLGDIKTVKLPTPAALSRMLYGTADDTTKRLMSMPGQ